MNVTEAFASYENVRHRLLSAKFNRACRTLPNLDALTDEIDVFLLDAFGVLNIGDTAIEGVPERVARLQNAGKRVMIVSNAAGFPHAPTGAQSIGVEVNEKARRGLLWQPGQAKAFEITLSLRSYPESSNGAHALHCNVWF